MKGYLTNQWDHKLDVISSDRKSIYDTVSYLNLNASESQNPTAFVYENDSSVFVFPFLKSKIPTAPDFYDFETAYGYGGPITNSNSSIFIKEAWRSFCDLLFQEKIICGFCRLSPFTFNHLLFQKSPFLAEHNRNTIIINLKKTSENYWQNDLHSKHRNAIRKAQKEGLSFSIGTISSNMNTFKQLYHHTMSRINADRFYFFNDEYFNNIPHVSAQEIFLAEVKLHDTTISSAIILCDQYFAHYHLSGSNEEYLKYSPNTFLLFKTVEYLIHSGQYHQFHLGGGTTNSPQNTLYRFKKRFSKSQVPFYISKMVLNEAAYQNLCQKWEQNTTLSQHNKFKNFFLKYRITNE